MKYLKKFNESYKEPFIYKSPDNLVRDIKEIFYILSDYGCEIKYDNSNDYELDIEIEPKNIDNSFSSLDSLISLREKLIEENELIYVTKLIEVCQHLDQLKEDVGGFEYKFYGNIDINDNFTITIEFEYEEMAIINVVNNLIYLNDDIIVSQLKYINDNAEYDGWEVGDRSFFFRFLLK
jgi:hypothetical protein